MADELMLYRFTLPEARAKKNPNELVNGRYQFKDGKYEVLGDDGPKVAAILGPWYGCKVEKIDVTPKAPADADTTLAKTSTAAPTK